MLGIPMLAQYPRESTSFTVMNNTAKQASSRADKLFAGAKNIFRSIFVAKLNRNEYKRREAVILYKGKCEIVEAKWC